MKASVAAFGVILTVCVAGAAQDNRMLAKASINDVAWLAGVWQMTQGPVIIEERWTPPAGGSMLATSRTIANDQMVAFEFLRIVERAGGLVYIAQPGGNPPTEFFLTELSGRRAKFENPAHDFPKQIEYALQSDGTLRATVGDGARKLETFTFLRR